MSDAQLILVASGLLAAGVLASLLAGRMRLPGLLLFLAVGMAIGTDGAGWIDFADYELARTVGIVALVLILFEGGLAAGWDEIRPVLPGGLSLAIGGTIGTALITGFAAAWLLDLPVLQGLLLGSIVSTTDSAAVFSVLRGSSLRRRLGAHAGGGVRPERPRRHPPGPGFHRVDPDTRLWDRGHGCPVRRGAGRGCARGPHRRRGGRHRLAAPPRDDERALSGGVAGGRRARIRSG